MVIVWGAGARNQEAWQVLDVGSTWNLAFTPTIADIGDVPAGRRWVAHVRNTRWVAPTRDTRWGDT